MSTDSLLEGLVEKILLDLLAAQDASNKASAKLAERYLNPKPEEKIPNLEFFPVPNSSIKSFDFSLKFLLKDLGIILRGDAKSKIEAFISNFWESLLESLFQKKLVTQDERVSLSANSPQIDLNTIFDREIELTETTLSALCLKEIILQFINHLPERIKTENTILEDILLETDLKDSLNEILFQSSAHQQHTVSDMKAVFDLNQLNNASKEVICSINVYVEMRNFDSAYYNAVDKGGNTTGKRTILTHK